MIAEVNAECQDFDFQPYHIDIPHDNSTSSKFILTEVENDIMAGGKRKLDENDVPVAVDASVSPSASASPPHPNETSENPPTPALKPNSTFGALGLDSRLLQAIAKKDWSSPLEVQSKAIPLALEGKDILARSGTGTGKTGAYVLPILQSILQRKAVRLECKV